MRYPLIFFLYFSYSLTFAQQNILIKEDKQTFEPEFIRLVVEYEKSLSDYDVSLFNDKKNSLYTFNNEPKAFWVQFTLRNEFNKEGEFYLSLPGWQEIELIDIASSNQVLLTGSQVPYRRRSSPQFNKNIIPINIEFNESKTYFALLKYNNQTVIKPTSFDLTIIEKNYLNREQIKEDIIIAFFLGIFSIMFFYNLFIFSSVKTYGYFYYLGLVVFNIFTLIFNFGYHFAIFTFDEYPIIYPYIDNILSFGYAFFMIQLSRSFLNIKVHFKKFDLYLKILLGCVGLTVLLQFTVMEVYDAFELSSMLGLLTFISLLTIAIKSLKKRIPSSKYFLFAISFFLFGLGVYLLKTLNLLAFNQYNDYSLQIGASLQLLFYAFGLANQINILKKENEHKQRLIISQLQEKEEIQQFANEDLEKQVILRTDELNEERNQLKVANSQILSSIRYAKKLQGAVLKSPSELDAFFKNYFIFFQPKAIVSGDYYWVNAIGDKIIWAVCDCTGHGVPGSMMSMIGHSLLNEIILSRRIYTSSEILENLQQELKKVFHRGQENVDDISDGMDLALCVYDTQSGMLEYSGALNDLWIVRNSEEIVELKADRVSIGKSLGKEHKYFSHQLILKKGDIIYSFTDGIIDQFGGEKDKKFNKKRLRKLLLEISCHELSKQGDLLSKHFFNWKKEQSQTDDVLVMAVKFD